MWFINAGVSWGRLFIMAIQFENCPVILEPQIPVASTFEDVFVMANSVQLNDNLPMTEIRRLGREGGYAGRPESPVEGQLSIDFVYGNMSVDVDGSTTNSPLKAWFDNLIGVVEYVNASVGPYVFKSGLLTDFSFSSQPNSVVNASVSFVFYNSELSKVTSPSIANPSLTAMGHGIHSSGDYSDVSIGLNNHPFSFSYSLSQAFEPTRYAGEVAPAIVQRRDGQIVIQVEGDDLGNGLTTSANSLCKESIDGAMFAISGLCGNNFKEEYPVEGYIQDRDISVSEGDVVRGSLSIIDYF